MSLPYPNQSPLGVFVQSPLRVRGGEVADLEYELYISGFQAKGTARYDPAASAFDGKWIELFTDPLPYNPTFGPLKYYLNRLWAGHKYWNGFNWILPAGGQDAVRATYLVGQTGSDFVSVGPAPVTLDLEIKKYNATENTWEPFGTIGANVNGVSLYEKVTGPLPEDRTLYLLGNAEDGVITIVSEYNTGTAQWQPSFFLNAADFDSWNEANMFFGNNGPLGGGIFNSIDNGSGILIGSGVFDGNGYVNVNEEDFQTFAIWDGVVSQNPTLRPIDDTVLADGFPVIFANYIDAVNLNGNVYQQGSFRESDGQGGYIYKTALMALSETLVTPTLFFELSYPFGPPNVPAAPPRPAQPNQPSNIGKYTESRLILAGDFNSIDDGTTVHQVTDVAFYDFVTSSAQQIGKSTQFARIVSVDTIDPALNTFTVTVNTESVSVVGNTDTVQTAFDLIAALQASVLPFISDFEWGSSLDGSPGDKAQNEIYTYKPVGYAFDPVLTVTGSGTGTVEDFEDVVQFRPDTQGILAHPYTANLARPVLQPVADEVLNAADPYSLQVIGTSVTYWELIDGAPSMTLNQSGILSDPTPVAGQWTIRIYGANARTYANGLEWRIIFQDDAPDFDNPVNDSVAVDASYIVFLTDYFVSGDEPFSYEIVQGPTLTPAQLLGQGGSVLVWNPTVPEIANWDIRIFNTVGEDHMIWTTTTIPAPAP